MTDKMPLKILIFDDDEAIRATLSKFVANLGFKVESFSDPDNCPTYLKSECTCVKDNICADIIITDINMPGITGISFIQNQIKNGCQVKNIAVMSGGWTEADKKKVDNLGCKIFEKPFSMFELKKWLDQIKQESKIKKNLTGIRYRMAQ
jgi:DNA-binding response OmpR family regulator